MKSFFLSAYIRYKLRLFLIVNILLWHTAFIMAQPGDPQSGSPDAVPIHGIIYLLAGGIILGLKKVWNHNKREN